MEQEDAQILPMPELDTSEPSVNKSPVGIWLPGSNIVVGVFLRHENHSNVYSARNLDTIYGWRHTDLVNCEVRTYDLEGIPQKLRQYRLRNMKRLARRIIFETRWHGLIVIAYKIDRKSEEGSRVKDPLKFILRNDEVLEVPKKESESRGESDGKSNEDSSGKDAIESSQLREASRVAKDNSKPQRKTDHQREMARFRQSEKRTSIRRKEQQLKEGNSAEVGFLEAAKPHGPPAVAQGDSEEADLMFVLLHLAYDDKTMLRPQLPSELRAVLENTPASRSALEKYLQSHDLTLEDDNEMEEFMKIKQRESFFLGVQKKKLPALLRARHDDFENVLRDQFKLPKHSKEWNMMQLGPVARARQRLKLMQHVQKILPRAVEDANETYQNLRKKLSMVREEKANFEKLEQLKIEHEKLKRRVTVVGKYAEAIVPGSALYARLMIQFHDAERELKDFELKFPLLSESLTDSQSKYQSLLGTLGDAIRTSIRPWSD